MIVTSLFLIAVAVVSLVLGLANGSSPLLIGSIAASLLAAIALVVGARKAAAARDAAPAVTRAEDFPGRSPGDADDHQHQRVDDRPRVPAQFDAAAQALDGRLAEVEAADSADSRTAAQDSQQQDGVDPADEPAAQRVTADAAAQVAQLGAEVFVVDGRPRYHLGDCRHLFDRPAEALPVHEAVELGFSPCALCRPVDRLLPAARRG